MVDVRHYATDEVLQRRYEYDDRTVVVADLGSVADDASVEVVDGTAVVVIETAEGANQYEFDLPGEGATTFINNGILTVEVTDK